MGFLLQDWQFWARDEQLAPDGDWRIWLFLGGRGAGKTRAGAEWIAEGVRGGRMRRIALVGATHNDARSVMIEGESGLLSVSNTAVYQPANRRVLWTGGAIATVLSADEADSIRGHQFDHVWADDIPTGSGGTGDVRATLSKQASGNTASFLFQDNFSGRAEVGLAGDDNFHFKVSPDGATWHDAIVLTASSGLATVAQAAITSADINGGTIDATAIGSTTPAGGAFTTLIASGAANLSPASANVTLSPSGTGTVAINPAATGAMNNVAVGATTAASGAFTSLTASGAANLSPASANVTLSPTGIGTVAINPAATGAMNNVAIGATTPASGAFTTLSANGAANLSPANAAVTLSPTGSGTVTLNPATAGTMNNVAIGGATPLAATFTSFQSNAFKDSKTTASTTVQADTAGRLLIGPNGGFSTSLTVAGNQAGFQVAGTNASANMSNMRYAASATGSSMTLAHSRAATIGSFATVAAADQLGVLDFAGDDGTTYNTIGAQIRGLAIAGGTISTGIIPGQIVLAAMNGSGALTDLAKVDATAGLTAVTQVSTPKVTSNAASALDLQTSGGTQFEIAHTASSVNYLQATGSASGAGTATLAAAGSDSNIDVVLTPKGSGAVRLTTVANGSVATALSSLGPTGSHATVQEWFAVKNASGTVRYIPAF